MDSRCTHTGIDEQLVKDKRIQTRPINFLFGVYNVDRTKNGNITRIAPLEIEINRYKKYIEAAVMDLNRTDMFLGYDWLVKHNPEVNWKEGRIRFTRYPGSCRIKHQDIKFKTRRIQTTETNNKNQQEIEKEPNLTNLEDLPDYIQPFIHLFNKKKFEKLPEWCEWDHEINLIEEAPKKLDIKAYAMIIKEEEALNQ